MLLEKLLRRQEELKMTDAQFAQRLGIPRSTWQLTRTGRKTVGPRIARAAQRAFPELTPDAVYFLLSDASQIAKLASKDADEDAAKGEPDIAGKEATE